MSTQTADYTWQEYERMIYRDAARHKKIIRIMNVIGSFVDSNHLPARWPGSVAIATAILEALEP